MKQTIGWKTGAYNTAKAFWQSLSGDPDFDIVNIEALARSIRRGWVY